MKDWKYFWHVSAIFCAMRGVCTIEEKAAVMCYVTASSFQSQIQIVVIVRANVLGHTLKDTHYDAGHLVQRGWCEEVNS